jgi:hypothetical protein
MADPTDYTWPQIQKALDAAQGFYDEQSGEWLARGLKPSPEIKAHQELLNRAWSEAASDPRARPLSPESLHRREMDARLGPTLRSIEEPIPPRQKIAPLGPEEGARQRAKNLARWQRDSARRQEIRDLMKAEGPEARAANLRQLAAKGERGTSGNLVEQQAAARDFSEAEQLKAASKVGAQITEETYGNPALKGQALSPEVGLGPGEHLLDAEIRLAASRAGIQPYERERMDGLERELKTGLERPDPSAHVFDGSGDELNKALDADLEARGIGDNAVATKDNLSNARQTAAELEAAVDALDRRLDRSLGNLAGPGALSLAEPEPGVGSLSVPEPKAGQGGLSVSQSTELAPQPPRSALQKLKAIIKGERGFTHVPIDTRAALAKGVLKGAVGAAITGPAFDYFTDTEARDVQSFLQHQEEDITGLLPGLVSPSQLPPPAALSPQRRQAVEATQGLTDVAPSYEEPVVTKQEVQAYLRNRAAKGQPLPSWAQGVLRQEAAKTTINPKSARPVVVPERASKASIFE